MVSDRPFATRLSPLAALCAVALALPVVFGCQQASSQQPAAPPPPSVSVAVPVSAPITDFRQFTGQTEAVESVEIRARVQGFLQEIHFTEGTEVNQGDLLYTIDPRTFQAEVDRAAAEMERLQAQLSLAESEERRAARLRQSSAVTEEEYAQRVAARQQAQASVQEAQAALDLARINLSFTEIRAPISGRVGSTNFTAGNLVGFNEPTLLTTIVKLDPIYVLFEGTERRFLEYERRIREEGLATAADRQVPVFVGLEGEQGFPHQGVIDFRANRVDPGTGTIQIRATIPNQDRLAVPGMFARVRVPIGQPMTQQLIPQTAVGSDQRGPFVYVVGSDNVVQYRPIRTGRSVGNLVIVQDGLTSMDRVVVNGVQKARPGAPVESEVTQIEAPSSQALSPAEVAVQSPSAANTSPAGATSAARTETGGPPNRNPAAAGNATRQAPAPESNPR